MPKASVTWPSAVAPPSSHALLSGEVYRDGPSAWLCSLVSRAGALTSCRRQSFIGATLLTLGTSSGLGRSQLLSLSLAASPMPTLLLCPPPPPFPLPCACAALSRHWRPHRSVVSLTTALEWWRTQGDTVSPHRRRQPSGRRIGAIIGGSLR